MEDGKMSDDACGREPRTMQASSDIFPIFYFLPECYVSLHHKIPVLQRPESRTKSDVFHMHAECE